MKLKVFSVLVLTAWGASAAQGIPVPKDDAEEAAMMEAAMKLSMEDQGRNDQQTRRTPSPSRGHPTAAAHAPPRGAAQEYPLPPENPIDILRREVEARKARTETASQEHFQKKYAESLRRAQEAEKLHQETLRKKAEEARKSEEFHRNREEHMKRMKEDMYRRHKAAEAAKKRWGAHAEATERAHGAAGDNNGEYDQAYYSRFYENEIRGLSPVEARKFLMKERSRLDSLMGEINKNAVGSEGYEKAIDTPKARDINARFYALDDILKRFKKS